MKPRYTDAFWGEHPFDGYMILIKNKNKNKKKRYITVCAVRYPSFKQHSSKLLQTVRFPISQGLVISA